MSKLINQGIFGAMFILAFLGVLAGSGHAQPNYTGDTSAPAASLIETYPELQPQSDSPNTGNITLAAGVDFTTAYFFRGILQEDQGFIAQPWAEASFLLAPGRDRITDVSLTLGMWNSVHNTNTGHNRANDLGAWYETDFYFTLSAGVFEDWSVGLMWVAYTSPNDAFATIQEINVAVGYDDSAFWERMGVQAPGFSGLQPSVTLAFEVEDTAFGTDEGVYLQLGIEPTISTVIELDGNALMISFPMTLGLSLADYYEDNSGDDAFGFLDVGIVASIPIGIIPAEYGVWELAGGVHLMLLGDSLETAQ